MFGRRIFQEGRSYGCRKAANGHCEGECMLPPATVSALSVLENMNAICTNDRQHTIDDCQPLPSLMTKQKLPKWAMYQEGRVDFHKGQLSFGRAIHVFLVSRGSIWSSLSIDMIFADSDV